MINTVDRYLLTRLKIRQLLILVTVNDYKNILRASKHLNMTQPAVTKSIKELEEILGASLFDRSSRGVEPTIYGNSFIKYAKLVLSELRHAGQELSALKGGATGRIVIGSLLAATPRLLPKALIKLKQKRPGLSVTIIEGTNDRLIPTLRSGEIDMIVGRLPDPSDYDGVEFEELYYEPVRVVGRCQHPLTKKKKVNFEDILQQQWILPLPETSLRNQLNKAFRESGFEGPENPIETVSILMIRTLLFESDLIAVLPEQVVRNDIEHGLLKVIPIEIKSALSPVGIITRVNKELTPAAAILFKYLKDVTQEHIN